MISDEKRCIFVHIPKTGGTSIEDAIWGADWSLRTEQQLWMGAVRPGFNKYQSGGLQHLLASQIRTEVGAQKFDEYFKFAFVRNPWDKVVSQFHYLKTRPMLRRYMGVGRWGTFNKYVRVLGENSGCHVQSYVQGSFLTNAAGDSLVDFVGRFENLQADFDFVAQKIGLMHQTLPHSTKSERRKPYVEYYNAKTRAIVADIYQADIQQFGYEFGQP